MDQRFDGVPLQSFSDRMTNHHISTIVDVIFHPKGKKTVGLSHWFLFGSMKSAKKWKLATCANEASKLTTSYDYATDATKEYARNVRKRSR